MNNLAIQKFYKDIINLVNACGLPVGTAYFVVKDILHDLEQAYLTVLKEEINESDQEVTEEIELYPDDLSEKGDNI